MVAPARTSSATPEGILAPFPGGVRATVPGVEERVYPRDGIERLIHAALLHGAIR